MSQSKKLFVEYLNRYGTDFASIIKAPEFSGMSFGDLSNMYAEYLGEKAAYVNPTGEESDLCLLAKIFKKGNEHYCEAEVDGDSKAAKGASAGGRSRLRTVKLDIKDYRLPFLLKDREYFLRQQLTYIQELYELMLADGVIDRMFLEDDIADGGRRPAAADASAGGTSEPAVKETSDNRVPDNAIISSSMPGTNDSANNMVTIPKTGVDAKKDTSDNIPAKTPATSFPATAAQNLSRTMFCLPGGMENPLECGSAGSQIDDFADSSALAFEEFNQSVKAVISSRSAPGCAVTDIRDGLSPVCTASAQPAKEATKRDEGYVEQGDVSATEAGMVSDKAALMVAHDNINGATEPAASGTDGPACTAASAQSSNAEIDLLKSDCPVRDNSELAANKQPNGASRHPGIAKDGNAAANHILSRTKLNINRGKCASDTAEANQSLPDYFTISDSLDSIQSELTDTVKKVKLDGSIASMGTDGGTVDSGLITAGSGVNEELRADGDNTGLDVPGDAVTDNSPTQPNDDVHSANALAQSDDKYSLQNSNDDLLKDPSDESANITAGDIRTSNEKTKDGPPSDKDQANISNISFSEYLSVSRFLRNFK